MPKWSDYIESLVLILFVAAWGLQSLAPVVMQQFAHQHEAMMCDLSGNCENSFCSVDGTCSCSHTASENSEENTVTLCGCNHHGNAAVGVASPFQIKADLLTELDHTITFDRYVPFYTDHKKSAVLVEEIFHPPRLTA